MDDPRYQKLAQVLTTYSLKIKPGDRVAIWSPMPGARLVREVYREALRAGAHPVARLTLGGTAGTFAFDGLTAMKLREGNEEQLRFVEGDLREVEGYDALLMILADEKTNAMADVDPARMALFQQARGPLMQRFMERWSQGDLRWCITLCPTEAHAQDAGMSLDEYEDFVFGAGLLNEEDPAGAWHAVNAELRRIAEWLGKREEIHVVAPDTNLTSRVGGRTWVDASGINNFPDGEVFTGPVEDSVNGTIRFSYPAVYGGVEVEDVRLRFRDGKVVEATAARGQEFLDAMLDQDPGARYVGEVAFGMNYGIKQFTRNILFDEKLGGTMHLALGMSIPHTGGKNQSSLHWDMICDLRAGRVYADGELCYEAGKFTI